VGDVCSLARYQFFAFSFSLSTAPNALELKSVVKKFKIM
jgi:hypothetical protein